MNKKKIYFAILLVFLILVFAGLLVFKTGMFMKIQNQRDLVWCEYKKDEGYSMHSYNFSTGKETIIGEASFDVCHYLDENTIIGSTHKLPGYEGEWGIGIYHKDTNLMETILLFHDLDKYFDTEYEGSSVRDAICPIYNKGKFFFCYRDKLFLYDLKKEEIEEIVEIENIDMMSYDENTGYIYYYGITDVYQYDIENNTTKKVLEDVYSFDLSPDGQQIVCCTMDDMDYVSIYDIKTCEMKRAFKRSGYAPGVVYSENGKYILLKDYKDVGLFNDSKYILKAVLDKNTLFNENNINAVEQLAYAKDNSWRATKSTCVQKHVIVMPEMTDLIVNSKNMVVEEIGHAIGELEALAGSSKGIRECNKNRDGQSLKQCYEFITKLVR